MTEEELHKKMKEFCSEEVRKSGWWIFNKKSIAFEKTKLVEECNIQTIQQLPEKICFPKKTCDVIIDDLGIKDHAVFYSWKDIIATGIKKEQIPMEFMDEHKTYILIGLTRGQIMEIEIRDNTDFSPQVGHFLELYKIKFQKNNFPVKD